MMNIWKTLTRLLSVLCIIVPLAANAQEQGEPASGETASTASFLEEVRNPEISLASLEILLVPLTAENLAGLASVWQGHLQADLAKMASTNLALQQSSGEQEDAIRPKLEKAQNQVSDTTEKYQAVLTEWSLKGGITDDIKSHQNFIRALTAGKLRTIDFRTFLNQFGNWLISRDGGLGLLLGLAALVAAIWIMMFVARFARSFADRSLQKATALSRLLKSFIVTAVYWAVFAIGILVVLGLFGFNVTPLFAVFGGLSFIVGFALQETLGNLASGLMIMVLKPFDTGDFIQAAGASGTVDEMSVVSTQIRTFDNQIVVVPNSKIWGDVITNVSASDQRRVDLVFGIGYGDDAAHAINVLNQLVADHKLCLSDPVAEVFVGELGDSSVNIFCRPWVNTEDYWTVFWDLTGQAKERFDAEGISIPFPQRDVHLISSATVAT